MDEIANVQLTGDHHSTAVVERGAYVGAGVTLGCFVQVCGNAHIGNEAVIEGLTIIPPNVFIGDRVQVGHGVCFVTPISDAGRIELAQGAVVGAQSIIHQGVSIGAHAVISPGAVVQRSVPSMAIVEGSPARIVGYVGTGIAVAVAGAESGKLIQASEVRGVHLHNMPRVVDIRGNLTVGEFNRTVPFPAKRYFIVFDVPSAETRGEHAHRECHQFLICVRGSCAVVADDGVHRQEFFLDKPDLGLHLSPMVWGIQYKYSADAVLLVFASHHYDNADYIRDYSEFRQLVGASA